jgi:hypothetical protein
LDQTGLINNILEAAINIDFGRKGFAARGKEAEGRLSYEKGIAAALSAFQEAQTATNPQILLLAEYTFVAQELQFCHKIDKDTFSSLTEADDAFLALEAVEELGYKTADKTYPHKEVYRVSGYPKDAFHIACIAHRTRLQNVLRAPGIDPIEKALLKQRFANMKTAQDGYVEKQRKVL